MNRLNRVNDVNTSGTNARMKDLIEWIEFANASNTVDVMSDEYTINAIKTINPIHVTCNLSNDCSSSSY